MSVIEFPISRVRGGALPLSVLTDAIYRVFGRRRDWFFKGKRVSVTDRSGLAMLTIERLSYLKDGACMMLRTWNDETSAYDKRFLVPAHVDDEARRDCTLGAESSTFDRRTKATVRVP
jgi:hypothetical protein